MSANDNNVVPPSIIKQTASIVQAAGLLGPEATEEDIESYVKELSKVPTSELKKQVEAKKKRSRKLKRLDRVRVLRGGTLEEGIVDRVTNDSIDYVVEGKKYTCDHTAVHSVSPYRGAKYGRITGMSTHAGPPPADVTLFTEKEKKKERKKMKGLCKQVCNHCGYMAKKGELKCCGGCKKAWYCNKTCQRNDWKGHKKVCARRTAKKKEEEVEKKETLNLFGSDKKFVLGEHLGEDQKQEWRDTQKMFNEHIKNGDSVEELLAKFGLGEVKNVRAEKKAEPEPECPVPQHYVEEAQRAVADVLRPEVTVKAAHPAKKAVFHDDEFYEKNDMNDYEGFMAGTYDMTREELREKMSEDFDFAVKNVRAEKIQAVVRGWLVRKCRGKPRGSSAEIRSESNVEEVIRHAMNETTGMKLKFIELSHALIHITVPFYFNYWNVYEYFDGFDQFHGSYNARFGNVIVVDASEEWLRSKLTALNDSKYHQSSDEANPDSNNFNSYDQLISNHISDVSLVKPMFASTGRMHELVYNEWFDSDEREKLHCRIAREGNAEVSIAKLHELNNGTMVRDGLLVAQNNFKSEYYTTLRLTLTFPEKEIRSSFQDWLPRGFKTQSKLGARVPHDRKMKKFRFHGPAMEQVCNNPDLFRLIMSYVAISHPIFITIHPRLDPTDIENSEPYGWIEVVIEIELDKEIDVTYRNKLGAKLYDLFDPNDEDYFVKVIKRYDKDDTDLQRVYLEDNESEDDEVELPYNKNFELTLEMRYKKKPHLFDEKTGRFPEFDSYGQWMDMTPDRREKIKQQVQDISAHVLSDLMKDLFWSNLCMPQFYATFNHRGKLVDGFGHEVEKLEEAFCGPNSADRYNWHGDYTLQDDTVHTEAYWKGIWKWPLALPTKDFGTVFHLVNNKQYPLNKKLAQTVKTEHCVMRWTRPLDDLVESEKLFDDLIINKKISQYKNKYSLDYITRKTDLGIPWHGHVFKIRGTIRWDRTVIPRSFAIDMNFCHLDYIKTITTITTNKTIGWDFNPNLFDGIEFVPTDGMEWDGTLRIKKKLKEGEVLDWSEMKKNIARTYVIFLNWCLKDMPHHGDDITSDDFWFDKLNVMDPWMDQPSKYRIPNVPITREMKAWVKLDVVYDPNKVYDRESIKHILLPAEEHEEMKPPVDRIADRWQYDADRKYKRMVLHTHPWNLFLKKA